jgi:hypothetical protein
MLATTWVTVSWTTPNWLKIPPPSPGFPLAVFAVTLLLSKRATPLLAMPPPIAGPGDEAVLEVTAVDIVRVAAMLLAMPPPWAKRVGTVRSAVLLATRLSVMVVVVGKAGPPPSPRPPPEALVSAPWR